LVRVAHRRSVRVGPGRGHRGGSPVSPWSRCSWRSRSWASSVRSRANAVTFLQEYQLARGPTRWRSRSGAPHAAISQNRPCAVPVVRSRGDLAASGAEAARGPNRTGPSETTRPEHQTYCRLGLRVPRGGVNPGSTATHRDGAQRRRGRQRPGDMVVCVNMLGRATVRPERVVEADAMTAWWIGRQRAVGPAPLPRVGLSLIEVLASVHLRVVAAGLAASTITTIRANTPQVGHGRGDGLAEERSRIPPGHHPLSTADLTNGSDRRGHRDPRSRREGCDRWAADSAEATVT